MVLPTLPGLLWVSRAKKGTLAHSAPGRVSKSFALLMKSGFIALGCPVFGGQLFGERMSIGCRSAVMTPSAALITAGRKL